MSWQLLVDTLGIDYGLRKGLPITSNRSIGGYRNMGLKSYSLDLKMVSEENGQRVCPLVVVLFCVCVCSFCDKTSLS